MGLRTSNLSPLLTITEVAVLLGRDARTVRRWILNGLLPPELVVSNGMRTLIRRAALEALLEGRDFHRLGRPTA